MQHFLQSKIRKVISFIVFQHYPPFFIPAPLIDCLFFQFSNMVLRRCRPSKIISPQQHLELFQSLGKPRQNTNNIVLGQVHLDVAKYHELNRFCDEGVGYDQKAAIFHVKQAAYCGVVEGLLAAAQLLLGLPHYILPDVEVSAGLGNARKKNF